MALRLAALVVLLAVVSACGVGGVNSSAPSEAGANFVPADDPGFRYEGHWDRKAIATTVNSGSRIRFNFSGKTLKGAFDIEGLTQPPQIYLAIDDSDLVQYFVDSAEIDFTPTPLADGEHTALLVVRDVRESAERWTPPFQSAFQFRGITIDGAMGAAPEAKSLRMEFYGDSITQGVLTDCGYDQAQDAADYVGGTPNSPCTDGTHDYSYMIARAFDADMNQVGFGAQGITRGGGGGVPTAAESFGYNFAGSPADPAFVPDVVVINQGTNDSTGSDTAGFQAGYEAYLRQVRTAYPDAWILALQIFGAEGAGSNYNANIVAAVEAVADAKIVAIDTAGWTMAGNYDPVSHLHPLTSEHRKVADRLIPIISELTGFEPAVNPDLR